MTDFDPLNALRFVAESWLVGSKTGYVCGDTVLVSPAMLSLLKGAENETELLKILNAIEWKIGPNLGGFSLYEPLTASPHKTEMSVAEKLKELNAAFLVYARSEQNPHGGYAAYEVGEMLPWLVVFMAGSAKRFATAEEAKDAVEEHVSYATDAYLAEMSYLSESE